MSEMMEIYRQERERLERELEGAGDVNAAADCLCAALERLRLSRGREEDPVVRVQGDRLFGVARQAVKCMMAVTEADVKALPAPAPAQRTLKEKIALSLPAALAAMGAVLTVWLIVEKMTVPAILSVLVTGGGWLCGQMPVRKKEEMTARPRISAYETLRMTDRLVEALDSALDSAREDGENRLSSGEKAQITGEVLEPVQMLMEAASTQDGSYALKALPKLAAALMDQGIEALDYSPENEECFDMFPGTEAGITIRPALMREGRLLVRGQATSPLE